MLKKIGRFTHKLARVMESTSFSTLRTTYENAKVIDNRSFASIHFCNNLEILLTQITKSY